MMRLVLRRFAACLAACLACTTCSFLATSNNNRCPDPSQEVICDSDSDACVCGDVCDPDEAGACGRLVCATFEIDRGEGVCVTPEFIFGCDSDQLVFDADPDPNIVDAQCGTICREANECGICCLSIEGRNFGVCATNSLQCE